MRLINAVTFEFEEFFDEAVPQFAILSHRWASSEEELLYADFASSTKRSTSGYSKVRRFCKLANERNIQYCWVDTCCIDKSSSAELSEAINSMYSWYRRAFVCFAYLPDVTDGGDFTRSQWFQRGWTLQELLAPDSVEFFDMYWRPIGNKIMLKQDISLVTGIDEALLAKRKLLSQYSVAQRMSWASHRKTTRLEDEAYCLMGLFDVHMPLLYGEGRQAFRRLQEQILAGGEDTSLFAWGHNTHSNGIVSGSPSILASSPQAFDACGNMIKGFATQRILFEVTNRGMMVLIHRSYNKGVLNELLEYGHTYVDDNNPQPVFMTIPLSCYQEVINPGSGPRRVLSIFLRLALSYGKWRRAGIDSMIDRNSWVTYEGKHYPAYANDYIRIYIHDDRSSKPPQTSPGDIMTPANQQVRVLHLQDVGASNMDFDG